VRDALEDDPADVGPRLLAALTDAAPVHLAAHRWRFATVARPLDGILREGRLLAGGDWTAGRRAGDAVRAGHDLARAVLDA
jgi:renalase